MENQNSFIVDDSDDSSDGVTLAQWSVTEDEPGEARADSGIGSSAGSSPAGRESNRVNLAARRAVEDHQERRRLRELIGDDLLDY